jgi:flagellar basal-body rod modification protein FlgD
MITQLAQFSSVEQIQGVNDRLDTLTLAQAAANQTQASVLVGKAVSYKTSQLNHTSGVPTPISAQIQGTPSSMTAVITDSQGRTVRTLNFGAQVPGPFTGTWDGRDLSGAEVPSGAYSVKLIATDASGNVIPTTTQASGKVTGINFVGGSPQLLVNGTQVPLGSVIEINQAV